MLSPVLPPIVRELTQFLAIVSRVRYLLAFNHIMFCPNYLVPNAAGQGGKVIEVDYSTKRVLFERKMSAANS
jgi:arylsulfate sulfotransferase